MSGRKRFFVPHIDYPENSDVVLDGEEFVHARTVQRIDVGDEIILLDGSEREYSAVVDRVEKRSLTAHIVSATVSDREPKEEIYLLCGALKGDKTELVVQKATELGASKIGVFSSAYCSAFMNANKLERLNKVAREASKQCLRTTSPGIIYFDNFSSAVGSAKGYDNKLFACEFSADKGIDTGIKGKTAVIVGSEGGFSEEEFSVAVDGGFTPVTLGKRILRAETACIAILSIVSFALGELK